MPSMTILNLGPREPSEDDYWGNFSAVLLMSVYIQGNALYGVSDLELDIA